jgi:hypothetical protein
MARRNRANRNMGKNTIQNVRVVDSMAGQDGLKVDRQLAALHDSASQTQMLCTSYFDYSTAATETLATISWGSVANSDDFVSLANQFLTWRVRSMRFDVYDLQPQITSAGLFSTFHDQFTSATAPVYSFVNVVDGPDSTYIPPGVGKVSLSWVAHTTNEKGFYDVTSSDANREDFGGLRVAIPPSTSPFGFKYRVIMKAIVDFRGRR